MSTDTNTNYYFTVPNVKYLNLLHDYIASIFPTLDFYLIMTFQLTVTFTAGPLSSDNLALLTSKLSQYVPPQSYIISSKTDPVNIVQTQISSIDYTLAGILIYTPDILKTNESLDQVKIIANLTGPDKGITDPMAAYSIRLYDSTNNNVIAEITGNQNQILQLVYLTNLQNLPTSESIFEIQAKINDPDYMCSILNIQMFYIFTIS